MSTQDLWHTQRGEVQVSCCLAHGSAVVVLTKAELLSDFRAVAQLYGVAIWRLLHIRFCIGLETVSVGRKVPHSCFSQVQGAAASLV